MKTTRPRMLRWLAWPAVAAVAATALALPQHAEQTRHTGEQAAVRPVAAAASRPNILLITTDDQALTDLQWMPYTRRLLGGHGATFSSMISPHPLCCPARAEILSGQYAQNNGVRANTADLLGGYGSLRDRDNTVGRWLQDGGYRTAFVGKFLNQYKPSSFPRPAGWDVWSPLTKRVYSYFDYAIYQNGRNRWYHGVHSADTISRLTDRYIRSLAAGDRPFFIWSSQVAPHNECAARNELDCWRPPRAARRHAGKFPQVTAPDVRRASFNEQDVSDKPDHIRRSGKISRKTANNTFRQRIRSLQAVDEGVASAVETLRRVGELSNTLILFTSDNGYLIGEHRFVGKVLPYEPALRVPLLMRGPGIPAGVVRSQTASTVDLAATVADAAGVRPGRVLDGHSLLPAARSGAVRRTTLLVQGGPRNRSEVRYGWFYRGVRTSRYTYVRYAATGFEELYDRIADPDQLENRAGRSTYAGVLAEMRRRLGRLQGCSGSECRQDLGSDPGPQIGPGLRKG